LLLTFALWPCSLVRGFFNSFFCLGYFFEGGGGGDW